MILEMEHAETNQVVRTGIDGAGTRMVGIVKGNWLSLFIVPDGREGLGPGRAVANEKAEVSGYD